MNYKCNDDGIPHTRRGPSLVALVKAYLPLASQQSRPEPSPDRPRTVPHLVKATSDAILAAAKKRDEPPAEPSGLAKKILDAGRRRRGEID
jgi:hypothetical protein